MQAITIPSPGPDLPDQHDWQVGDELCALLTDGGYAEQVAVPVGRRKVVLAVPRGNPPRRGGVVSEERSPPGWSI